jgi:hypothetical protein
MINNPTEDEAKDATVNVTLRDGNTYIGRDIPSDPYFFKGMFTFCGDKTEGRSFISIPLDLIARVDMYFE